MSNFISVNEGLIKSQLGEMVWETVEDTLNALLDQEDDRLCQAAKYEPTEARKDSRAGKYHRKLETKAGEIDLAVPKLIYGKFETAIIERYKRPESSVEESLIEMYLAGVSVRRVEDITEALWGSKVSPATISNLNQKAYGKIEVWRNRRLDEVEYPYVYADGVFLKRNFGGEYQNVSVLVAIGVNKLGFREILGACEGAREDKDNWRNFLVHLKERGLTGVKLFITDKCLGAEEAIRDVYPDAKWQRCAVHFYRNMFSALPYSKTEEVMAMLKAIHASEDLESARQKAKSIVEKLESMKLRVAAEKLAVGIKETLTYMNFPREHWMKIRTTNGLERINRELKRRTRVVGTFPDGQSALMLVCARLRYVAASAWGTKRYLNMNLIQKKGGNRRGRLKKNAKEY
ncbi:MAG: IS256 family transposase [Spirochaetes bacterium]|nr:IS256 family transposase [Spirochaetota bacterium]